MDQLNIIQWNAQSILSNKRSLQHFLYDNNIHIAIISETWLRTHHRFNIRGFSIARNDSGNKHNGVAILVHNSIRYSHLRTFSDDSLQNICIQVSINNKSYTIASLYCPTKATPHFEKNKFDALVKSLPKPVIIAGDFNAHHSAWGCNTISPRGRDILDVVDDNNLIILNNGDPTTVGTNKWQPNALDLTIVSLSLALISEWNVHDDPLGSYHLPAMTNITFQNNNNIQNNVLGTPINKRPNYKLVNWEIFSNTVDELFNTFEVDSLTPNEVYDNLCNIFHLAIIKSLPTTYNANINKNTCRARKRLNLPWWNEKCSLAVENSKNAYINFKHNPTQQNFINFKRLQAIKKLTLKQEQLGHFV